MDELTIEVAPRGATGKNESRRLRAAGQIPGVVYGGGREPVTVAVDRHTMLELMRKARWRTCRMFGSPCRLTSPRITSLSGHWTRKLPPSAARSICAANS